MATGLKNVNNNNKRRLLRMSDLEKLNQEKEKFFHLSQGILRIPFLTSMSIVCLKTGKTLNKQFRLY